MIWKVSSGDFKDIIDGLFLIKISCVDTRKLEFRGHFEDISNA